MPKRRRRRRNTKVFRETPEEEEIITKFRETGTEKHLLSSKKDYVGFTHGKNFKT
jgi:hypothetical protein